jgi:hypothetical protein
MRKCFVAIAMCTAIAAPDRAWSLCTEFDVCPQAQGRPCGSGMFCQKCPGVGRTCRPRDHPTGEHYKAKIKFDDDDGGVAVGGRGVSNIFQNNECVILSKKENTDESAKKLTDINIEIAAPDKCADADSNFPRLRVAIEKQPNRLFVIPESLESPEVFNQILSNLKSGDSNVAVINNDSGTFVMKSSK